MRRLTAYARFIDRYRLWQESVVLTSPFVIFCGIIACVFLLYRFVLVVVPLASIGESAASSKSNIVCGEEEGNEITDQKPLLSASYQERIRRQTKLSSNLVMNPSLSQTDPASGQPVGFTHAIEQPGVNYLRGQGMLTSGNYLRVTSNADTPKNGIEPAWLMTPVTIQPDHTYAYSFMYRSTVPVNVSVEYTTDSKTVYKEVMLLKSSDSWQRFSAHFTNRPTAKKFRIDISSTHKGHVDTRDFDIHEIPSAELSKGIVSIAFDDGWQSIADKARPLLNKYDIPTTQYVIADVAARGVPGYMDYSAIRQLRQEGNEIGSHSLRHCDQTLLSTKAVSDNARKSRQMLEDEKLGTITSFAYPLGRYNEKTQGIYKKEYPLIRSSDFGYNDRYFDETNIHSIGILSTTTDKEFQAWVDYAKKHGAWVVFVYHKIDGEGMYTTTSAQFERQLKIITASGLETKTVGGAARSIR